MDELSILVKTYYDRMSANYCSAENLKITPDNVFQEGIPNNYDLFIEMIDRLMVTGSRVRGIAHLRQTLDIIREGKSVLFLMKHQGNFDVPCFYSLVSREGERYREVLDRLVFIAGRKLNEDSLMVKTFSEIFSRLIIVPKRELPPLREDETPDEKRQREEITSEALRINRAALRMLRRLMKEGRIIVLFPLGGRPKPWLQDRGVKETTSYMRLFDFVHFIGMEGNLLAVGRDMKEELPQRDRILFTISEPVATSDYLDNSRRLFEVQSEETDFDQFNVDRVMVEIGHASA